MDVRALWLMYRDVTWVNENRAVDKRFKRIPPRSRPVQGSLGFSSSLDSVRLAPGAGVAGSAGF